MTLADRLHDPHGVIQFTEAQDAWTLLKADWPLPAAVFASNPGTFPNSAVYPDRLAHISFNGDQIGTMDFFHEAGHVLEWAALIRRYPADRVWAPTNAIWADPANSVLLDYYAARGLTLPLVFNGAWATQPAEQFAETFMAVALGTFERASVPSALAADRMHAFFTGLFLAAPVPAPAPTPVPAPAPTSEGGPMPVIPASNYHVGRDGNPVTLIIDHWTDCTVAQAIARFTDPASIVSAHYIVGQDGTVHPLVSEADTAYQAGDYAVNLLSIGIEHEASPTMPPSDALYAASAALHRDIAARHGIALQAGVTVKPHRAIVPTECPGTLDYERIVNAALEDDMFATDPDAIAYRQNVRDTLEAMKAAYDPLVAKVATLGVDVTEIQTAIHAADAAFAKLA